MKWVFVNFDPFVLFPLLDYCLWCILMLILMRFFFFFEKVVVLLIIFGCDLGPRKGFEFGELGCAQFCLDKLLF